MPDKPKEKSQDEEIDIVVKNPLRGRELEEMLAGLRQQQTVRGRKEFYAPIDPTIYPSEYKKPVFSLTDVNALIRLVSDFPSGKIEIQKCDRKQKLTRVQMDRRQAFMQLLNQAVWRYKYFKETDFVKPEDFRKKTEKIKTSIEALQTLLNPNLQDEAGRFVIDRLDALDAPLAQARLSIRKVGLLCQRVELALQNLFQLSAPVPKKPRNQGDTLFPSFMDDLLKIWVVIFERDVGISSKENERTGPMLRFIRAVFAKADIKKSDDTIVKASYQWKRRYCESYKLQKSE